MKLNALLFHWINNGGFLQSDTMDWWMTTLSDPKSAVWPFLVIGVYWAWQGGREGRHVILGLVLLLAFSDWTGGLIKDWLQATRPCNELEDVRLLASWCGVNGFPSNHAANIAAFATYTGLFYRRTLWLLVPLAFAVGMSRIYVGVHYPGDVLFGWVYGMTLAIIAFHIPRYRRQAANTTPSSDAQ